jgi:hypothetical protein
MKPKTSIAPILKCPTCAPIAIGIQSDPNCPTCKGKSYLSLRSNSSRKEIAAYTFASMYIAAMRK